MAFINVMCNMSVDCDCCAVAENPCMKDIGVLASLDPIAIDMACIDLVKNSNDEANNIVKATNEEIKTIINKINFESIRYNSERIILEYYKMKYSSNYCRCQYKIVEKWENKIFFKIIFIFCLTSGYLLSIIIE